MNFTNAAAQRSRFASPPPPWSGEHISEATAPVHLYQQAAEMAIKGALDRKTLDHAGHSLIALLRDLETSPPETLVAAARRLSRLYIPTRYPDAAGAPPGDLYGQDDAEQAARDAQTLMEHCARSDS